jgi:hypothetical protein
VVDAATVTPDGSQGKISHDSGKLAAKTPQTPRLSVKWHAMERKQRPIPHF